MIITNVGGMPEVIKHNENGLIIPSNDPHAFAQACIRLYEDRNLRKGLSNLAYQKVKNDLSLDKTVQKTYDLYKEVHGK